MTQFSKINPSMAMSKGRSQTIASALVMIDARTLKTWLDHINDTHDDKHCPSVCLIDVREAGEYASERIPGAISFPLSHIKPGQIQPEQIQLKPGQCLVLYCQSGRRSAQAAEQLSAVGIAPIYQLNAGLNAWKAADYPVETSQGTPISLFRQVQIVAGLLVILGTVLGAMVSPSYLLLSGLVGGGLVFAGVTNTCAMGMLLAKLPYNQRTGQHWHP
jgi:rhodanese-related sulfurtransferase